MSLLQSFTKNNNFTEYAELIKPTWAPPNYLFGPVWTILYLIIITTYSKVFLMWRAGEISTAITVPFIINIIANLLFTPLQFGLKNNLAASIDIVIILASLMYALYVIYPYNKIIAYANTPYLLWVCFATVLQLTITYLNA